MKQFYVYVHCKPDGTPFYVGKGSGRRAYDLGYGSRKNKGHACIVGHHNKKNLLVFTRNCESEQQAFEHERWMKKWCDSQGYRLVNTTDGGEGARPVHLAQARRHR